MLYSKINAIHCKSPRWKLENPDQDESAQLDFTINGQNYIGSMQFTFTKELRLHRDVPMASINEGNKTLVSLITQGVKGRNTGHSVASESACVKWGLLATERINMTDIRDYTYNHDAFINSNPGVVSLKAYENEAAAWPRVDTPLQEGGFYEKVSTWNMLNDGVVEGVAYLEVGFDETLQRKLGDPWVLYTYDPSSVEFYSYKQPNILRIFPTAGLTKGGTFVEIMGTSFTYMP